MRSEEQGEGRFEANWKALGVTALAGLAIAAAVHGWPLVERWQDERQAEAFVRDESAEEAGLRREAEQLNAAARQAVGSGGNYPPSIEGSLEAARVELGADLAFELDDQVRAYAFRDSGPHDWDVVFYRPEEGAYARFGPVFGPTGFDAPETRGDPPALWMRLRDLDVPFRFRVTGDQVSFDPYGVEVECELGCEEDSPTSRLRLERP